jgi:hypothetical protein
MYYGSSNHKSYSNNDARIEEKDVKRYRNISNEDKIVGGFLEKK